jgi:predicted amidohydrolase
MDKLAITLIQSHLHWENPIENRANFSEKIKNISERTDLIILPEMFSTGFSMNTAMLSEEKEGETLKWMILEAKRNSCAITGSIIIKEGSRYFNRLYFVFPNGDYKPYDKRHTFTLAGEDKIYAAGEKHLVVDYKGWKICPLICYDLRFPVWARNTWDYDVLIYVANWPVKRIIAWDTLLRARAIENMSYCVGVNRVGLDGNGYQYVGHSAVYDVLGSHISNREFEKEFIETIILEKSHIKGHRDHLQFLQDRDHFSLG